MKNRGFTLVELLAVITLMALLALAAFELLDSVNKGNKEKAENVQISNILTSAISYISTSEIKLPDVADAYADKRGISNCAGKSNGELAQASYNDLEDEKKVVQNMQKEGYTKICSTRVSLKYLSEVGIVESRIKNPITGKYYSMAESEILIYYITNARKAEEELQLNLTYRDDTKMDKPWKYDGNYLYFFDFKEE